MTDLIPPIAKALDTAMLPAPSRPISGNALVGPATGVGFQAPVRASMKALVVIPAFNEEGVVGRVR
ncbi:MAG: hypothetical protein NTY46_16845 [Candidatus Sumerlaeota bacterium]|nr:hypothetical protein [Candidatus Sumerlaeota bacterium]